jgi:hypothetical protein
MNERGGINLYYTFNCWRSAIKQTCLHAMRRRILFAFEEAINLFLERRLRPEDPITIRQKELIAVVPLAFACLEILSTYSHFVTAPLAGFCAVLGRR